MASNPLHTVLDHLRRLHRVADTSQRSDDELLRAFVAHNDQDAFAAVVTRHAPLVWGVCRRILGHQQDAEDAFQATFLVLARRAGSIRAQSSIGGWLHTVAQRLAVRARKQAEQRRIHEREASQTPSGDAPLRELAAVVDEELRRLPAKYREPLLLHYLQGATAEAAAQQLGLGRTAFYKRLAYGRELLRERLARQGLSLAAPLLAAALTPEAEAAWRLLIQATIRGVAGNVSERVAALAAESLGAATMMKLKIGLALGLLLGVAAGGVAVLTPRAAMAPLPQAEHPAEPSKAQDKTAVRVDHYGDPLPPGAVARLGTLRWRACGEVESLAFAPDGKTVLSVSPRGVPPTNGLCLFDAATGKRIKSIRPPGTFFRHIALSADGKRLAAACTLWPDDKRRKTVVQIRELPSGRKLQEWKVEQFDVEHLSWLGWSDGQPLAAYLGEGEMRLLELATGRERRFPPKDLPNPIRANSFACVVGKKVLAASDENAVIHVWNLADGKERCVLKTGSGFVRRLTLSPNERWLASLTEKAAGEYSVLLWDTATGQAVHHLAAKQTYIEGIIFSPDGKTLATVGWWEVCFWDVASARELGRTKGNGRTFGPGIAFSPDGKTLAATERYSSAIHLWDVPSGAMKPQAEGHTNRPHTPAFSPDGKRLATSSAEERTIFIWDPATGVPRLRIRRSGELRSCAFSADGRTLYSFSGNQLLFFDAANGRELHVLKVEDPHRPMTRPFVRSLHPSDDRAQLLTVSTFSTLGKREMQVSGWDTSTRKQLFQYKHPWMALGYALSADGRMLAAPYSMPIRAKAQASGPMRLEDAQTGETLLTFPTLEGQTWPLAFSPDGRLLASNNSDRKRKDKKGDPAAATGSALHLWETAAAAEVLVLPLEEQRRIAFAPDGRILALTAPGGDLLLWDLRRGEEFRRFKDFGAQVTSLAFSPDGRRLVSGLSDSTLLVWDVGASPASFVKNRGAEELAKAWADLADAEAPRAFRARGILASAPEQAIPLLRKHLHPVQPADPPRLHRLLADLDSEQFAVREKAQKELEKLGDLAEVALRRTLANKPSLEMRCRVESVLERLRGPVRQPELLQALRAVAVLEDIATPEARRLLEELAKGAAEARLTREAKDALRRICIRTR